MNEGLEGLKSTLFMGEGGRGTLGEETDMSTISTLSSLIVASIKDPAARLNHPRDSTRTVYIRDGNYGFITD